MYTTHHLRDFIAENIRRFPSVSPMRENLSKIQATITNDPFYLKFKAACTHSAIENPRYLSYLIDDYSVLKKAFFDESSSHSEVSDYLFESCVHEPLKESLNTMRALFIKKAISDCTELSSISANLSILKDREADLYAFFLFSYYILETQKRNIFLGFELDLNELITLILLSAQLLREIDNSLPPLTKNQDSSHEIFYLMLDSSHEFKPEDIQLAKGLVLFRFPKTRYISEDFNKIDYLLKKIEITAFSKQMLPYENTPFLFIEDFSIDQTTLPKNKKPTEKNLFLKNTMPLITAWSTFFTSPTEIPFPEIIKNYEEVDKLKPPSLEIAIIFELINKTGPLLNEIMGMSEHSQRKESIISLLNSQAITLNYYLQIDPKQPISSIAILYTRTLICQRSIRITSDLDAQLLSILSKEAPLVMISLEEKIQWFESEYAQSWENFSLILNLLKEIAREDLSEPILCSIKKKLREEIKLFSLDMFRTFIQYESSHINPEIIGLFLSTPVFSTLYLNIEAIKEHKFPKNTPIIDRAERKVFDLFRLVTQRFPTAFEDNAAIYFDLSFIKKSLREAIEDLSITIQDLALTESSPKIELIKKQLYIARLWLIYISAQGRAILEKMKVPSERRKSLLTVEEEIINRPFYEFIEGQIIQPPRFLVRKTEHILIDTSGKEISFSIPLVNGNHLKTFTKTIHTIQASIESKPFIDQITAINQKIVSAKKAPNESTIYELCQQGENLVANLHSSILAKLAEQGIPVDIKDSFSWYILYFFSNLLFPPQHADFFGSQLSLFNKRANVILNGKKKLYDESNIVQDSLIALLVAYKYRHFIDEQHNQELKKFFSHMLKIFEKYSIPKSSLAQKATRLQLLFESKKPFSVNDFIEPFSQFIYSNDFLSYLQLPSEKPHSFLANIVFLAPLMDLIRVEDKGQKTNEIPTSTVDSLLWDTLCRAKATPLIDAPLSINEKASKSTSGIQVPVETKPLFDPIKTMVTEQPKPIIAPSPSSLRVKADEIDEKTTPSFESDDPNDPFTIVGTKSKKQPQKIASEPLKNPAHHTSRIAPQQPNAVSGTTVHKALHALATHAQPSMKKTQAIPTRSDFPPLTAASHTPPPSEKLLSSSTTPLILSVSPTLSNLSSPTIASTPEPPALENPESVTFKAAPLVHSTRPQENQHNRRRTYREHHPYGYRALSLQAQIPTIATQAQMATQTAFYLFQRAAYLERQNEELRWRVVKLESMIYALPTLAFQGQGSAEPIMINDSILGNQVIDLENICHYFMDQSGSFALKPCYGPNPDYPDWIYGNQNEMLFMINPFTHYFSLALNDQQSPSPYITRFATEAISYTSSRAEKERLLLLLILNTAAIKNSRSTDLIPEMPLKHGITEIFNLKEHSDIPIDFLIACHQVFQNAITARNYVDNERAESVSLIHLMPHTINPRTVGDILAKLLDILNTKQKSLVVPRAI